MTNRSNSQSQEQGSHGSSTEILIIISQTVFFVLLFFLLKHGLIDRKQMLVSKEKVLRDRIQLAANIFVIFMLVALAMVPCESYEYGHIVIPISYSIMIAFLAYEIYFVFQITDATVPTNPEPTVINTSHSLWLHPESEDEPKKQKVFRPIDF